MYLRAFRRNPIGSVRAEFARKERIVRIFPTMKTDQIMNSPSTMESSYLRGQLEQRRQRLAKASTLTPTDQSLTDLAAQVDEALARMDAGTYGICDECHDTVEKERLLTDPLVRLCLDHLSASERRALESDLELAAKVQRALLPPRDLHAAGWQAHYHYSPLGAVSGDYVDLILSEAGSGSLIFAIGDVSGKGVAASMLMSQLSAVLRSLISVGMPLDELLMRMNSLLSESVMAGQFATLVVGRAAKSGAIELVSAGHLPALRVGNGRVEAIHSTALPIGMFSELNPVLHQLSLAPGESLVLFTDGISEQMNPAGNEFGTTRLSELVAAHRELEPRALVAACLNHLEAFQSAAPKTDDRTLLALRHVA